jgi:hypothetical protein
MTRGMGFRQIGDLDQGEHYLILAIHKINDAIHVMYFFGE